MLGVVNINYEDNNVAFDLNVSKKTIFYMNIKKEISEKVIFNYLKRFFLIIDTWQEEYPSFNIIDHNDWRLCITFNDGYIKKYSGSSNFPVNFEEFVYLNQDLVKGEI